LKNSNNEAVFYLIVCLSVIKARDIPAGQSKTENPEKQNTNTTKYVLDTNTTNVNKT
jgi:hypothetical protein